MAIVFTDNVTPLNAAYMNLLEQLSNKNVAGGYVGLEAGGGITVAGISSSGTVTSSPYFVSTPSTATQTVMGDLSLWTPGNVHAPGILFNETYWYRSAAGVLESNGQIRAVTYTAYGAATTYSSFIASITGEAQARMIIDASGKINWGPGTSSVDTTLYRSAANQLKTDGALVVSSTVYSLGTGGLGFYYASLTAAGYPFVSTKQGDAQNFFAIRYDGQLSWGPGGSGVPDTALYRIGVGSLKTDTIFISGSSIWAQPAGASSGFNYNPGVAGNYGFNISIQGEPQARFLIDSNGGLSWGSGAATQDAAFYRAGAGLLLSNATIASSQDVLANRLGANQIWLNADGSIYFGNAADTRLYRVSANTLRTVGFFVAGKAVYSQPADANGGFVFNPGTVGGYALNVTVGSEAQPRYLIDTNGIHAWGPGGAVGTDVTLYRAAANQLRTNGSLLIDGGAVIDNSNGGNALYFGSALDTNIVRLSANTLKMSGTFQVGVGIKFPDNTVQITAAAGPGLATTLPGSPVDGQEAILVDSLTLPTYAWRFRYTASITDAYKRVYVGGAPIVTEVATVGTIHSGTYGALASAGPSFALPRAGIYEVEVGARMYNNTANADAAMSYDIGGTGAVDADAVDTFGPGATDATHNSMVKTKTIATAVTLTAKYRSGAGSTASFEKRFMRVVPVRVA